MRQYYEAEDVVLYHGDCRNALPSLPAESVSCVVTSRPFYGPILLAAASAHKDSYGHPTAITIPT